MTNFIRGFFWLRPVPYGDGYLLYERGQAVSISLGLIAVPMAIFALGFIIGRTQ